MGYGREEGLMNFLADALWALDWGIVKTFRKGYKLGIAKLFT